MAYNVKYMNSKNTDKMKQILENIKKAQDSDGHWYWIPKRLLAEFTNELKEITGLEYMDNPDAFDLFSDKYEQYRTLGDPGNMPDFFDKQKS